MDIQYIFSEKLKYLMSEKDLSEMQLAKHLQLSFSIIYKYSGGKSTPSVENAIKISDYFKCSLNFLFGYAEEYQEIQFHKRKKFSEWFQELLKEKGIKRQDLKKTNLFAKQSIDDWFNDVRLPTIENLIELREYFGCTLDYLVGRDF